MNFQLSLYRYFIFPLAFFIFFMLRFFIPKVAEGFRARQGQPWLKVNKLKSPIWFHCASGEFEYAKPVLRQLKAEAPERPILVTHFSPSVAPALAKDPLVDLAVPLPWDTPKATADFLDHHKPAVLAIARTDLWPELLYQVDKRKIPSLIFSKTANSQKSKLQLWWGRLAHKWIQQTFVVSEADRSLQLKVQEAAKVTVAGDTRYDQCLHRKANPTWQGEVTLGSKPVVLLASTWPADEAVVLPGLVGLMDRFHFIIVPHEPTPSHLKSMSTFFKTHNVEMQLFSENSTLTDLGPTVVDSVGILADLYRYCDFAYVGGSFDRGVHSVMEPLAWGKPCLVGPKNRNNREVQEFRRPENSQNIATVQEVWNTNNFVIRLEQLSNEWQPSDTEALIKKFESRAGATKTVVQWIQAHGESPILQS